MSKKQEIQYQDPLTHSYSDLSSLLMTSGKVVDVDQNFNLNIAQLHHQSNLLTKKKKKKTSKQQLRNGYLPQHSFPLDIQLLNLFRNPKITDHNQFHNQYLQKILNICDSILQTNKINKQYQIYILYLHFIFSLVQNLMDFSQLGIHCKQITTMSRIIDDVNIINVHCIQANIKLIQNLATNKISETLPSQYIIEIMKQPHIITIGNQKLSISKNYIDKSLYSYGQYDIFFSAFLIHKLQDFLPLIHYFAFCKNPTIISSKYAEQYEQLMDEQITQLDYNKWYNQQISNVINGTFSYQQLRNRVLNGQHHQILQKLLIGLLGWDQKLAQEAVVLLNVYYDNINWQFNSPFKPIICQVGQDFQINYLIDNKQQYRQNLILCLKSPCMSKGYRGQLFTWHHLKIKQYTTDDDTYLWIKANFKIFTTCGFYDWKLFQLSDLGNKQVKKIVNLPDMHKFKNNKYQNNAEQNIYSVRSVQGRFIVHPEKTRKLQIHQIYMDSLSCMENSQTKTTPQFSDAIKDISRYAEYGINCVYLMGVFERDSGKFQGGYRRPQASSMALTSRTTPCSLLGGQKKFTQLMTKSKQIGMKVITDCTARVSSSQHKKIYQHLKLFFIDQSGKKYPFYGCQGRSINYQDTMLLNYRKLQSWDLLINQTIQVISKYGINGIYLDNGISWPQICEINKQQMLKKDQDCKNYYTNIQIFQGTIIHRNKHVGYWFTKNSQSYPNPFYIKLVKKIWQKYDQFLFICQSLQITDSDQKIFMSIYSGLIPRICKMTKAVAQIIGINLQQNGSITNVQPKNVQTLKKWYEQVHNFLPQKAILIQSTSSHAWPYPAYIFRRATWAYIDLIFFLPQIPMTFIGQQDGKAYRTKTTSVFFQSIQANLKSKNTQLKRVNSSFFCQQFSPSQQKITSSVNATVKDPTQIKYLQQAFRRQVGPQFGFDLSQIYQHYKHRRKLRSQLPLLTSGKMMALTAQHKYGIHKNILSFAKWNHDQILIISINFNQTKVFMHYNLTKLKHIFTKPFRSNVIVKISVVMGKKQFCDNQLFTVAELITSKIQTSIDAYQSIIWRCTVNYKASKDQVYQNSMKRIAQRINSQPPKWIYSSIFTNQLIYMLDSTTMNVTQFLKRLQFLYLKFIQPNNLNFSLVISKTHQFWLNPTKLSKLFGIFKIMQNHPQVNPSLKKSIQQLRQGNILGPIAFVTPQIGSWSSVGGLGVMVDQLSKQLVKLGEQVYIITPYYQYNKKKQTNYLARDGFIYSQNIKVWSGNLSFQFGIHRGKYQGVNYIWFHNSQLFSKPYQGQGALFVSKQLVFFALTVMEIFCQLKIFPSIIATNDWMCGFVSAYVKIGKFSKVFNGTKFMHIVHNLDPLYEGRLYPKPQQGDLNWLIQLPTEWYIQYRGNRMVINPSKCALQTCNNWGTVSHSYKYDLLKDSPLSSVLWKHSNPFSFPNGVRKDERVSLLKSKTPGSHLQSKKILQEKYFGMTQFHHDFPIFTFIGRITKQKGVHLIIDAFQQILHENNYKLQFLVGGIANTRQQYGKYCADKMRQLTTKYPKNFWSNPDIFFSDGPLTNIGSDFALMPSLFQPGGIVQHQFFCGGTPVIAFKTGGLKDTVFQFDKITQKGNGFNFMSYDSQDFKQCLRRALQCYKNKSDYQKLRQNAFQSVVQEQDVAKGWNTQFYRLQNKMYIDKNSVQKQILQIKQNKTSTQSQNSTQIGQQGKFWCQQWDIKKNFKQVLKNAQRLKGKQQSFIYQTQKIPRPKDVTISGSWDGWKQLTKMKFDRYKKNWYINFKLKPGTYQYKYQVDNQWVLNKNKDIQSDINGIENHIIVVQ